MKIIWNEKKRLADKKTRCFLFSRRSIFFNSFSIMLCWSGLNFPAFSLPANVVHFPKESIGDVTAISKNLSYFYATQFPLGPAKGNVTIPPGMSVILKPNGRFFRNPELLKSVSGYPIEHVCLRFNSVDESDEKNCARVVRTFSEVKSLITFDADNCDVSDAEILALSNSPNLKAISLCETRITGKFLVDLKLNRLEVLRIGGCILDKPSFVALNRFPKLKQLIAYRTNLDSACFEQLQGLNDLETINLAMNNEFNDSNVFKFVRFKKLLHLDLRQTKISSKALISLAKIMPNTQIDMPFPLSHYPPSERQKILSITNLKTLPEKKINVVNEELKTLFAPVTRH